MEKLSRFKGKLGVGATNVVACMVSIAMFFVLMFSSGLPHAETKREFVDRGDSRGILRSSAMDTGASSASKSYKGGIIFLEPNTQYTMKGGTYSGGNKTYGGAVYISEGATFTMDGGTITNCQATYGGGIYVRAGATCNILSGSITGCSATYGPAIFVEDGGILNVGSGVNISDNDIYRDKGIEISKDTLAIGNPSAGLNLHYTYFGSYPQTHVSDSALISELNNLKDGTPIRTYNIYGYHWKCDASANAYMHSDGEIYVFRKGMYGGEYKYKDGQSISSDGDWFKVEPIRWYVLNYDNKGSEGYELLSELLLTITPFSSSNDTYCWTDCELRTWCNGEFLNTAFTSIEQGAIDLSTIKNNVLDDYENVTSDGSGETTYDKIYLKSYYDMNSGIFTNDRVRLSSPSDFTVSQGYVINVDRYPTAYRKDCACSYWLRSSGTTQYGHNSVCYVDYKGWLYPSYPPAGGGNGLFGVRPALHVK